MSPLQKHLHERNCIITFPLSAALVTTRKEGRGRRDERANLGSHGGFSSRSLRPPSDHILHPTTTSTILFPSSPTSLSSLRPSCPRTIISTSPPADILAIFYLILVAASSTSRRWPLRSRSDYSDNHITRASLGRLDHSATHYMLLVDHVRVRAGSYKSQPHPNSSPLQWRPRVNSLGKSSVVPSVGSMADNCP